METAQVVIVQGPSGSGKTYSMRTVPIKQSAIITVAESNKPLSWRGGDKAWGKRKIVVDELRDIQGKILQLDRKKAAKYVFLEDFTHTQNSRVLSTAFLAAGTGGNKYARWETFGRDIYQAVFAIRKDLKHVKIIFIINHVTKNADGQTEFKSHGKMVGNAVDPVSYTNIVLHSMVLPDKKEKSERFVFLTQPDGIHEAKSPDCMFKDDIIPNDLSLVIKAIETYQEEEEQEQEQESQ